MPSSILKSPTLHCLTVILNSLKLHCPTVLLNSLTLHWVTAILTQYTTTALSYSYINSKHYHCNVLQLYSIHYELHCLTVILTQYTALPYSYTKSIHYHCIALHSLTATLNTLQLNPIPLPCLTAAITNYNASQLHSTRQRFTVTLDTLRLTALLHTQLQCLTPTLNRQLLHFTTAQQMINTTCNHTTAVPCNTQKLLSNCNV